MGSLWHFEGGGWYGGGMGPYEWPHKRGNWDEIILLIRIIIPFITGTWRIIPVSCFSG